MALPQLLSALRETPLLTRTSTAPTLAPAPSSLPRSCQEASARAPHPHAHVLPHTPLPSSQAQLTCPHLHLRRCPRPCSASVPHLGMAQGHRLLPLTQSLPSEKGKRLVPGKRDFPDRPPSPHRLLFPPQAQPVLRVAQLCARAGPSSNRGGQFSFRTRTLLARHQHPNSTCPGPFTLAGKPASRSPAGSSYGSSKTVLVSRVLCTVPSLPPSVPASTPSPPVPPHVPQWAFMSTLQACTSVGDKGGGHLRAHPSCFVGALIRDHVLPVLLLLSPSLPLVPSLPLPPSCLLPLLPSPFLFPSPFSLPLSLSPLPL